MALGEYGPRATYFSVADGAIIRRFKDHNGDPAAVAVTRKDGTVVYERSFKFIEGFVTKIEIASSTFNGVVTEKAQWKIHIKDGDDTYVLTMHYNSAYAKRFINCAASVQDWAKRIRISPWKMAKTDDKGVIIPDKYWLGVTLYAPPFTPESKYLPAFKREDIPDMKKVRYKGEDRWDDEEQMLFWEKVVEEQIMPRISSARSFAGVPAATTDTDHEEANALTADPALNQKEEFDDVPF